MLQSLHFKKGFWVKIVGLGFAVLAIALFTRFQEDGEIFRGQLSPDSSNLVFGGTPVTVTEPTFSGTHQVNVVPLTASTAFAINSYPDPDGTTYGWPIPANFALAARVATVDGQDQITLGSSASFRALDDGSSTHLFSWIKAVKISDTAAVVLYITQPSSGYELKARVVSHSNGVVSWGSPITIESTQATGGSYTLTSLNLTPMQIVQIDTNKFVVSMRLIPEGGGNEILAAQVFTVSGTSISAVGSPEIVFTNPQVEVYGLTKLNSTTVALFTGTSGTHNDVNIPVYVWNTTTSSAFSTTLTGMGGFSVEGVSDNKFLVVHLSSGTSTPWKVLVGSYDSNSGLISFGAAASVSVPVWSRVVTIVHSADSFSLVFTTTPGSLVGGATMTLKSLVGTISGTTVQLASTAYSSPFTSVYSTMVSPWDGGNLTGSKAILSFNTALYTGDRKLVVGTLVPTSSSSSSAGAGASGTSSSANQYTGGGGAYPTGACCLPKKNWPGAPPPHLSRFVCNNVGPGSQYQNSKCVGNNCIDPVGTVEKADCESKYGGKWFDQASACTTYIQQSNPICGLAYMTINIPGGSYGSSSASSASSFFPIEVVLIPVNGSSSSASSSSASSQPLIEIGVIPGNNNSSSSSASSSNSGMSSSSSSLPTLTWNAFGTVSRIVDKVIEILIPGGAIPPIQPPAAVPGNQPPGGGANNPPAILPPGILPEPVNPPGGGQSKIFYMTGAPESPEGKKLFLTVMFDWLKKFLSPTSN